MPTKDYFSGHASVYATFRPTYPDNLYNFILSHLKQCNTAWDCATGNGQVAQHLARHFNQVYATDISQQQINNAVSLPNIVYSVSKAELTHFGERQFDLTTVGQALHWFDRDAFYKEVARVSKPDALIAVWGYALLNISPDIDKAFLHFYHDVVGAYWDDARKLVEEEYASISFPFEQIPTPRFSIVVNWSIDQFGGYLSSWSATQKFIKANGYNPVVEFIKSLMLLWKPGDVKTVTFPVFMKLGRVH